MSSPSTLVDHSNPSLRERGCSLDYFVEEDEGDDYTHDEFFHDTKRMQWKLKPPSRQIQGTPFLERFK
jgi:hypothetical protein